MTGSRGARLLTAVTVPSRASAVLIARPTPSGPRGAAATAVGGQPGKEGVRRLVWGDPYQTAWLGAARGEPLKEADYLAAGLAPGSNPLRPTRREQS
jgi:hypothetical protein